MSEVTAIFHRSLFSDALCNIDMFLFGFIVPILPFMIEDRLHLNPSRTQRLTSALLTTHGFFSLVSAPIIGYFADKSPSRKIPLLAALAGCIIGTLLIAWTPSRKYFPSRSCDVIILFCSMAKQSLVWTLFLGRVLQAIAGSGAWVIGFALLTESVPAEDLGMTIGIAMTFVTAGILSGPAVAGLALELLGYWPTWSIPLGILALDLVSRLTVLEPRRQSHTSDSNSDDAPGETTGLLSDGDETGKERSGRGFYRIMLQDQRVLAGLLNGLTYSMVLSALDNTLPTHLKSIFDWGSFPTGLMFFGLQVSSIPLSGPFGYLRDRCGLKIPTTIGWILSALMLCSLGIPGYSGFPWAGKDTAGKPIFIGSILGLGMSTVLVRGVGFIVLSSKSFSLVCLLFGDAKYSRCCAQYAGPRSAHLWTSRWQFSCFLYDGSGMRFRDDVWTPAVRHTL